MSRIYINNIDSYLGQAIYRQLYNPEEESDNVIIGTKIDPLNVEKLPGTKKILKRSKPKLFRQYLANSDTIICDLHFGNLDDVEFIIDAMKTKGPFEEPKTLVLISSVLAWGETPRIVKPPEVNEDEENGEGEGSEKKDEEADEEKNEEEEKEEEEEESAEKGDENKEGEAEGENPDQEGNAEGEEGAEKKEEVVEPEEEIPVDYLPFKETDYLMRVPNEKYERLKRLEDAILNLNIENVKTFVICSGLFYGKGELAFKQILKAAWLQNPVELPYLGDGENLLPTIHIDDLAKFILKVVESPPENPYIFAFDNTADRRQKNLIQHISDYAGTHKTKSIEQIDGLLFGEAFEDKFRLNLDMVPSPLLVDEENPPDFEWIAEKGIPGHMDKILQEFCEAEHLKPIRIMIKGDKKARKTEFAKLLSNHYNIPVIQIEDILKDAETIEGELGQDFKEEKEKILDYLSAGQPVALNETLKVLYRLVRWRLRQNDCKNRGFILDDYPNHPEELQYIFQKKLEKKLKRIRPKPKKLKKKKRDQEEQGDEEKNKEEDGSNKDEGSENRSPREDEEDEVEGEKNPEDAVDEEGEEEEEEEEEEQNEEENQEPEEEEEEEEEEGELPRLESYFPPTVIFTRGGASENKNQSPTQGDFFKFFTERNIDVYMFEPANKRDDYEAFESLRIFIEKDGRPNNYLETADDLLKKHKSYYQALHEHNTKRLEDAKQETQKKADDERERRINIANYELDFIHQSETPDPAVKNMPFRNYLMKYITPVLGEGLLQISEILPDDPVDFLAEYLYKKSFELNTKKAEE